MKRKYRVEWTEYRRAYVEAESWEEAVEMASNLDDTEAECFGTDYWEAEPMEGDNETK